MAAESGKVIILTGASRGIGLAIAHYLLGKQTKLVVTARSKEALEKLKQDHPDQVEVLVGDAADFSLGERAAQAALSRWNRIDGLVVNHGVLDPVKKVADADAKEWRDAFDVNFFSAVALIKAALPALRSSYGKIVMTSSGAAVHGYQAWGAYGAAKAAMNHLAQTLATEEPDITTICIRPGTVDTEMQREIREVHHETMDPNDRKKFSELKSTGTLLRPEQPGNVIARLALGAPKALSGKFMSWSDVNGFQED